MKALESHLETDLYSFYILKHYVHSQHCKHKNILLEKQKRKYIFSSCFARAKAKYCKKRKRQTG